MRTLDRRALNRALLARNLLLERSSIPALAAVDHLVGLQAQEPQEPYVGLFSRLAAFDPLDVSRLIEQRALVRTHLMRRTMHLVTAQDCLRLRELHQPMLEQRMRGVLRTRLVGVDEKELAEAGRQVFERAPMTLGEAGRAVGARWPQVAARDLGDALSTLVALVQVPPRGLWHQVGPARATTVSAWLGSEVQDPAPDADALVLRYLAAFGPAATSDIRAWSGLGDLPAAITRLRGGLVTFRDERGRTLFDLPDAPLPDPDTAAPPRFLPAFDNAVLGYHDRSRIIDDEHRGLSVTGVRFLLVDGRVAGTWSTRELGGATELLITPLGDLARTEELDAEAARLLAFLAPDDAPTRVRWVSS